MADLDEDRADLSLQELRETHTPQAIRRRLERGPVHSYLRDFVFGAFDGSVTTFAIVAGVEGAGLPAGVVVVLGVANLLADGFSMGAGSYLAAKAEAGVLARQREIEKDHIRRHPEGEREEVRQIFARKGFAGAELESIVAQITSDVDRWVDTMIQEEHGQALEAPDPWRAGRTTFVAFLLVGALPLLAFVWQLAAPAGLRMEHPFLVSALLTGLGFFVVGVSKARFVAESAWRSGFETVAVGGGAAAIAYGVGALLRGFVA